MDLYCTQTRGSSLDIQTWHSHFQSLQMDLYCTQTRGSSLDIQTWHSRTLSAVAVRHLYCTDSLYCSQFRLSYCWHWRCYWNSFQMDRNQRMHCYFDWYLFLNSRSAVAV